jgi:hypothetical protein
MPFQRNTIYTRREIHDQVGGGLQDYLPHRNGRVVCACLRADLNPAPLQRILVGDGEDIVRWARVFAQQREYVPLFLKENTNQWRYMGMYRVRRITEDRAQIVPYSQQAGRDDVTMILWLEEREEE